MKKTTLLATLFVSFLFSIDSAFCAKEQNVRPAAVAGTFYPAAKKELGQRVEDFLAAAPKAEISGSVAVLIVPHAGYVYSGQVAAHGYKLIQGQEFDSVILIGPSHHAAFRGASIWQEGEWETPLGKVPVDSELAKAIAAENPFFQNTTEPHLPEHSLEVQLPFLQKTVKDLKIVPILLSRPSLEDSRLLAQAIVKHTGGKKVLIVASTDMSHYHPQEKAADMDQRTLRFIEENEPEKLFEALEQGACELCGSGAVLTVLEIAKLIEARIRVLQYATSGDVTGDNSRVVGYGASVLYQPVETSLLSEPVEKPLGEEQKAKLLEIARQTLKTRIMSGKVPRFKVKDSALEEKRGVFVTLKKDDVLRGCIGHILPQEPLYLAVRDVTVSAALEDYRFSPVTEEELENIEIEISVLSVPKKVQSPDEIELGKHGVILRKGISSGVFLPQVATETGWTKEQFLNELAFQKAGLPANAWKEPDAELLVFSAQVFSEKGK